MVASGFDQVASGSLQHFAYVESVPQPRLFRSFLGVSKLALGLVTYSRSFQLQSSTPGQGPGAAGQGCGATQPYSKQVGLASYYEILTLLSEGAEKTYDAARCGAYLQKDDLWMGFDDEESVRCKAAFIKENGLIGGLLWDLPEDGPAAKVRV